jgi:hypothetical protein
VLSLHCSPWHVFVDTSPATDADFVVAATFDKEPELDEINTAIVECLEGSEREDEIVAQQMQQQIEMESGQLNLDEKDKDVPGEDDEEDDLYDLWNEDST